MTTVYGNMCAMLIKNGTREIATYHGVKELQNSLKLPKVYEKQRAELLLDQVYQK